MKQKLKYLFMFMAVVILTNMYSSIAMAHILEANYRTITSPIYLVFKNYFLVLAFVILLTTVAIYFKNNKINKNRTRNIIILLILGVILSANLYYLGLDITSKYNTEEMYLIEPPSSRFNGNIGDQISGSFLINFIDTAKQTGIEIIVKTVDYIDDYTGMTYNEKLDESPDIVSTGRAISRYATYVVTAVNKKPNGEVASIEFSFTR